MDNYRRLGYAVLKAAVHDYYNRIRWGQQPENAKKQLEIADVWFDVAEVNREWFLEKVTKKGEELWLRRKEKEQQKKII